MLCKGPYNIYYAVRFYESVLLYSIFLHHKKRFLKISLIDET